MTTPLVSVVMPLYNKRRWVERALDSIARQTLTDIEVIVVDDGSTDGSDQIVARYPDSRFRLIRQENAGPGAARNRALEQCSAEFVAFLDGDDEWLLDYLESSVEGLQRLSPEVVAISCSYLNGSSDTSSESMWRARGISEGAHRIRTDTDPALLVHRLAFMHCCTTMARLDAIRRWGGFYAEQKCLYAEDAVLWLKILLNETVGFQLPARVRIHHDAGSLSQNLTRERPLEPFLERPEAIENDCPPELRPLLRDFLALRAFKTACMYGYWGHWRRAGELRQRFRTPGDHRLPYFWPSRLLSTPAGAAAGTLWRTLARRADPPRR